jgi:excisionase family DNA binding protein
VNPSPWLTAEAAGDYLHRSKRFVLREIKAGRLKAAKLGGRGDVLVRREWLDEYVEAQSQPVMVTVRRRAG